MFDRRRQTSLRSFLLGGLLGSVAGVLAAGGLHRSRNTGEDGEQIDGVRAFEQAPCHAEWRAREQTKGTRA